MIKKIILCAYICYLPLQIKLPNIPLFPIINIFFILLLALFFIERNPKAIKPRFELPLKIFLALWVVSFIYACMFSDGMLRTEIFREFKRIILLPIGYFVFARCMKDKKEVDFYVTFFLVVVALVSFNTYANGVLGGSSFGDQKRSSGPFGEGWSASDIAGSFIAYFAPFLLAYFFFVKNNYLKFFSGIGFILCILGIFATYSRGAMLGLGLAIIFVVLFSFKGLMKGPKVNLLIISLVIILAAARWESWVPQSIITRFQGTFQEDSGDELQGIENLDESTQMRFKYFQDSVEICQMSPLTGIGLFQMRFQMGHDPHNSFIQILGEMGIISLIVFIIFIFLILIEVFSLLKSEFIILGSGGIGFVTTFITVNLFYANFYRDTTAGSIWVILGLLAACRSILNEKKIDNNNIKNF